MATPRRRASCGSRGAYGWPSSIIEPESGVTAPLSTFISVDRPLGLRRWIEQGPRRFGVQIALGDDVFSGTQIEAAGGNVSTLKVLHKNRNAEVAHAIRVLQNRGIEIAFVDCLNKRRA